MALASRADASTGSKIPLVISVLGAGIVTGIVPAGLLPANVLNMEREFGLSHDQMGRIVGLCMVLGGGPGGLAGGWLCGRIGAIRNMVLSMALAALALGVVGFSSSLTATVGGIWGYFVAMGFMGSSNVLATVMFPDRQRGLAVLHTMNASGKLAGPVLGALFVYGVWRNSFIAAAVLPVLLIIPSLLAHTNGDTSVGRKHDKAGRAGVAFWLSMLGFGLIAGSEIAVALWVPAYAERVRGFSAHQANLLLSVFLAGLVAGRLVCGTFAEVFHSTRAIAICGACTVFAAPALLATSYAPACVFFFLFGLAFSATWPSYFAHMSHVHHEHLGLMGGAAFVCTQLGFAACSWASGKLAVVELAYPTVFGAVVMAAFVIVFFFSPLSRKGVAEQ